jgi:hypothetical protein
MQHTALPVLERGKGWRINQVAMNGDPTKRIN